MPSDYILAVDEGTTGITAMILDAKGQIVSRAASELTSFFPQPGWVEQDPHEIVLKFKNAALQAIAAAKIRPDEIRAMGLTNQRETTVLWNRDTLEPAARAVVWQCKRSIDVCERLQREGLETVVRARTGLRIDPYFSASKIRWILDHHPRARAWFDEGLLVAGTIDTWLIANLSADRRLVTDATNASRTMLYDIHAKRWDPELIAALGLREDLFARVQPSGSDFGIVDPAHFGAPIPILGVAGDQQASLFGHGCTAPGSAKCTFGTGAFAMVQCGTEAKAPTEGLLLTLACDESGRETYALEGSLFMAGAIVQWIRDQLALVRDARETEALARSIEDTGGVYLVPAFSGLGTPHWNPKARAAILGMTRGTGKAHLARAALEAIAFQTRELVDAFERSMGASLCDLRIDGGVSQNGFFVEFLADVLGKTVLSSAMPERTALGAGRLASVHPRVRDRFSFTPPADRSSAPRISEETRSRALQGWKRAVDSVIHFAAS